MVNIVTGKIDSGKTTYLLTKYNKELIGGGFISKKYFSDNQISHFTSYNLTTKQESMYCMHSDVHDKRNYHIRDEIGPYFLIEETISNIEQVITKLVLNKVSPIYIDEVGKLEINKKGLYLLLSNVINSNIEFYITCREDLVQEIIEVFQIKHFNIIEV